MAFERRDWGAGSAALTTITAQLTAGDETTFAIAASTNWPDGSEGDFYVLLDPTVDFTSPNSSAELILCSSRTGLAVDIKAGGRGALGTSDALHQSGARAWVVGTTRDLDEANYWIAELAAATNTAGDLLVADANNSLTTLAKGSNSTVLGVTSGGVLGYTTVTAAMAAADLATQPELDAHTGDTADAHDASAISFSPVGTIAGDDVQEAVAEVATDAATALSTHDADTTSVHGIADTSALLNATHTADTTAVHGFDDTAAVPRGVLGYAETTTPQENISTEADLTSLSVTVTVAASRRVRITGYVSLNADTGTSAMNVLIYEGATQLQDSSNSPTSGVLDVATFQPTVVLAPTAAEHTYKLRASSGINADTRSGATRPAFILVEDVGSSA